MASAESPASTADRPVLRPTRATRRTGSSVGYVTFFRSHPRLLSFGVLLTLFSSLGQTFLISVFVPQFLAAFSLDAAQFGTLYAAATLLSAASIPYFGRLLDRLPLRHFSMAVGLGLALASLIMALATHVVTLFLALLLLRLAGQGLLSLTASTAMARAFVQGRGRALSVSALGYPLGEGLLPLAVVLMISGVGWRLSWAILAGATVLFLIPIMAALLRNLPEHPAEPYADSTTTIPVRSASLWRDPTFYALLPGSLFLPLVITALFLYQSSLAEAYGWSIEMMATAFIGFAAARMAASLLIGPWIDRWGALRLFPFILLPISAGLVALTLASSPWIAMVYMSLAGVSQGIAGPTMTALWAEVYGVESLGATKGTVATIAIFATAVGPVLVGGLLSMSVPFAVIVPGCALLGGLVAGASLLVSRRIGSEATAVAA